MRTHTCTPGQPEPFTGCRGEEQVLTDSSTCYWKVCSPSVILGFTGLGDYCSLLVLTAKVFLDFLEHIQTQWPIHVS